jgi:hypothetical protein
MDKFSLQVNVIVKLADFLLDTSLDIAEGFATCNYLPSKFNQYFLFALDFMTSRL